MDALHSIDSLPGDAAPPLQPLPVARRRPKAINLNSLLVTAYKFAGFGLLSVILIGLISYFGVNLFYLFDHHWILPAIISPTDERVLQLTEQVAQQEALRQKLLIERNDLQVKLEDNKRIVEVEAAFQERFSSAVQGDVETRRSELQHLRDLFANYAGTKQEILKSSQAYSGLSRERSEEMMQAHLLEKDRYVAANYEISQIAHSNLSLAESEANLMAKTTELEHEISAMEGAKRHGSVRALSYDTLRMEQEFNHSVLDQARARDEHDAVQRSLQEVDDSIETYDRTLKAIRESPYLNAVEHHLSVAFIPYDNMPSVGRGTPLYACRFGLLGCSQVGRLGDPLDGEVTTKHPLHNQMLRGLMVDLDLNNPDWARQKVLFAGHPPLFF
jgi:hypothetical protein